MENTQTDRATDVARYSGSCHCGAVRFEAELDLVRGATKCNCSICTKVGGTCAICKPRAFTLLEGEGHFGEYAWGGKTATRFFCKHCGIHCFAHGHLPELGGDYVAINVNTLDAVDPSSLGLAYWDGRHNNWEAGPRGTPWPVFA
jgi:hypothetical protein